MLCEKCKNKKPTVFFTDADGKNRSLCASCASAYPQALDTESGVSCPVTFLPRPSLSSGGLPVPCLDTHSTDDESIRTRMPRRIRAELELADRLCELRSSLDYSIKHEEYEKAAQIRDKIKKLSQAN